MSWIMENMQWLFSGIGVMVIALLARFLIGRTNPIAPQLTPASNSTSVSASTHVASGGISIINNIGSGNSDAIPELAPEATASPSESEARRVKDATRILFIDDDVKFKVVKILKSGGWCQTSLVKDLTSLSDVAVTAADIIFVDIQGVGVELGFKDEGLGLAEALKEKYPSKKVVIYSAEPKGKMFHKALRIADGSIEKNADPYQFERMISGFVGLV